MTTPEKKQVLYIIVCGAPPASNIQELVSLARESHWDVCLIASQQAIEFMDIDLLENLTGRPVRVKYKQPGTEDIFPKPDAVIVAPATFNTINKWAQGIADTLAVSTLCEVMGQSIPIVAVPCLKDALAKHPIFYKSLQTLKDCRVRILYKPDIYKAPQMIPWTDILTEIDRAIQGIPSEEEAYYSIGLLDIIRNTTKAFIRGFNR